MASWLRLKSMAGWTLIEVMVSLTIIAIISVSVAMAIPQILNENDRANRNMQAVQQVEQVGYWIRQDVLMAQTVTPDAGASGFPLTLEWQTWGSPPDYLSVRYQVVYTLSGDGDIVRTVNGGQSNFVAEHINTDPAATSISFTNDYDGDGFPDDADLDGVPDSVPTLNLKVTATVGPSGGRQTSETRTYQIKPRPDLPAV